MAKSKPFTEQDLFSKGFEKDESGAFIKPIHKNLDVFPKSFTEPNNDIVGEIPEIKLDVKLEWFVTYNVPALKNSKQIIPRKGGGFLIIPSKKHKEYVTATAMQYTMYGIEFRRAVKLFGLSYPLHIEFTFIRSSKHSFDYGNILQTCEDIMKDKVKKGVVIEKGWFPDDSADYILPVFKQYEYDKQNPGVRIRLITNK